MLFIDEVEQLCALYKEAKNEDEKQKLRDMLLAKREELSRITTSIHTCISNITSVLVTTPTKA